MMCLLVTQSEGKRTFQYCIEIDQQEDQDQTSEGNMKIQRYKHLLEPILLVLLFMHKQES